MPGTSGLELPALLARTGQRLPVIFVTAHDTPETRELAHRLGAAGYFRKPVDEQALLDAIAWALSANTILISKPLSRTRAIPPNPNQNLPPCIDPDHITRAALTPPARADCSPCRRTRTPRSSRAKRSTRSPMAFPGSRSSSRRSSASPSSGSSTSCRKKSPRRKKHPQTEAIQCLCLLSLCLRRTALADRLALGLHQAGAAQDGLRHRRR